MNRMHRLVLLNQVAQGVRSFDQVASELDRLGNPERRTWLHDMVLAVDQSHPLPEEIERGLVLSRIKPTHTPCVLVLRSPLREALQKIRDLPDDEVLKSFRLLLAILGVADARRRARCDTPCHHWWHRDLSDPGVVAQIVAEGERSGT